MAKRFWADSRIGQLHGPDSVTLKHLFNRIGDALDRLLAVVFGTPLDEFTLPDNPWLDGDDLEDDSVGGNHLVPALVVPSGKALRSADYDPGVEGWIIDGDGDAEFNDATIRGSLEVGDPVLRIDDDGISIPIANIVGDDISTIKWYDPSGVRPDVNLSAWDFDAEGAAVSMYGPTYIQLAAGGISGGGLPGDINLTAFPEDPLNPVGTLYLRSDPTLTSDLAANRLSVQGTTTLFLTGGVNDLSGDPTGSGGSLRFDAVDGVTMGGPNIRWLTDMGVLRMQLLDDDLTVEGNVSVGEDLAVSGETDLSGGLDTAGSPNVNLAATTSVAVSADDISIGANDLLTIVADEATISSTVSDLEITSAAELDLNGTTVTATASGGALDLSASGVVILTATSGIELASRPASTSKHAAGVMSRWTYTSNVVFTGGEAWGAVPSFTHISGRLYKFTVRLAACVPAASSGWQVAMRLGGADQAYHRFYPVGTVHGDTVVATMFYTHSGAAGLDIRMDRIQGSGNLTVATPVVGWKTFDMVVEDIGPA